MQQMFREMLRNKPNNTLYSDISDCVDFPKTKRLKLASTQFRDRIESKKSNPLIRLLQENFEQQKCR